MISNKISAARDHFLCNSYLKVAGSINKSRNNIIPDKTITIFSNPRGGSTWLAEILNELPYSSVITEPLMVRKVSEFKKLGFYWNQPIPENAEWPEAEKAFHKLLNVEILPYSIYKNNNLIKVPFSKHYIFKFCYGNLLLPWIVRKFDIKPILLVRHPCAVVASQMKHKWSREKVEKANYKFDIPDFKYNDYYLRFSEILKQIKTLEENFAVRWALTMMNTVLHPENNRKWITVSYESLYSNYEYEINRIFNRHNLQIPSGVWDRHKIPSRTTIKGSHNKILHNNQLESWKNFLTPKQIDNIFGILNEFRIDFYDRSLEPDFNKIYTHNN